MITLIYPQEYTLTTYCLKLLDEAEQKFGKRIDCYKYGGIEFNWSGPQTWFPHGNWVVIQLHPNCANDFKEGIFELSHEVIHLLSPRMDKRPYNLEEGIAVYFSKTKTEEITKDKSYASDAIKGSKYERPLSLFEKLIAEKPDAVCELRKQQQLRTQKATSGIISEITKEDFLKAEINVSDDLIKELLKTMEY